MARLLKEFEERMLQRLDRDFYSQGLTLKEENAMNFSLNDSKINNENRKKRKLCENNGVKEFPLKKMKLLVKIKSFFKNFIVFKIFNFIFHLLYI